MNQHPAQQFIRPIVRGLYDLQKLRIETGNRIVANLKARLGQAPSMPEEDMEAEAKKLLAQMRSEYARIADSVKKVSAKKFNGQKLISGYAEFVLAGQYERLCEDEKAGFKELLAILKEIPIYENFLSTVKGCGPAIAGIILSEIDIHKSEYPSSLWKYGGLDVAADGAGRSRRKEHLVDIEYTNRDGEPATKKGITFNPWLKTKLIGVFGPSLLRAGREENKYAQAYYDYKHRIENHPAHAEKSKGHRHNMAIRYMVKRFLVDLYIAWRTLEGLPVAPEYSEAKLGIVHKKASPPAVGEPQQKRKPKSKSAPKDGSKPKSESAASQASATPVKSLIASERATLQESPGSNKHAARNDAPKKHKRAIRSKVSVTNQRASNSYKPVVIKRAISGRHPAN